MLQEASHDIVEHVCVFLSPPHAIQFLMACKVWWACRRACGQRTAGTRLCHVQALLFAGVCPAVHAVRYIAHSLVFVYDATFCMREDSLTIESATVVFVNCQFVNTATPRRIFVAHGANLHFVGCRFEAFCVGKVVGSVLRMDRCVVHCRQTTFPVIVMRMASLVCRKTTGVGGNTFVFVNGRPLVFRMEDCRFHSRFGIELHNCCLRNERITTSRADHQLVRCTNNTQHFTPHPWLRPRVRYGVVSADSGAP